MIGLLCQFFSISRPSFRTLTSASWIPNVPKFDSSKRKWLTVVVGLAYDVLLRVVVAVLSSRVPHPSRNLAKERKIRCTCIRAGTNRPETSMPKLFDINKKRDPDSYREHLPRERLRVDDGVRQVEAGGTVKAVSSVWIQHA